MCIVDVCVRDGIIRKVISQNKNTTNLETSYDIKLLTLTFLSLTRDLQI